MSTRTVRVRVPYCSRETAIAPLLVPYIAIQRSASLSQQTTILAICSPAMQQPIRLEFAS